MGLLNDNLYIAGMGITRAEIEDATYDPIIYAKDRIIDDFGRAVLKKKGINQYEDTQGNIKLNLCLYVFTETEFKDLIDRVKSGDAI